MANRRSVPQIVESISPASCTVDHRLEVLRGLPFFHDLSHERLEEINRQFRSYDVEAGATIYMSGDRTERLYVVAHGRVKLLRHSASGEDTLLDILATGEMFGTLAALGDVTYPDTAEAQTFSCVLGIGAHDFQAILDRSPDVALRVLGIVAKRLQEAHTTISQISTTPAEARVAAALVKLAGKLGVPDERGTLIQTRISRQDIAAMTGTTTETASRVMSQLRRDGVIESGRQWIVVIDLPRLTEIAEMA
ncbi:MAG: Crp/Fnr family transcriptional regulator [Thermomicrobiales bacterium]